MFKKCLGMKGSFRFRDWELIVVGDFGLWEEEEMIGWSIIWGIMILGWFLVNISIVCVVFMVVIVL